MAFKSVKNKEKKYTDIESLFRDLPSKDIQSLYSHQADIIRHYQENAISEPNVAIELPTGSGKTLVGILIAEFRRRAYGEKVLYLCPTKQLVNQVVELANTSYGVKCISFTGSHRFYTESDKFAYRNGDTIAVSTYSSLFNIKPWFEEPDLVILDDAHTSENYIASCWSLLISRHENTNAYNAIIDVIKDHIPYSVYGRLVNQHADYFDKNIVEKYPSQKLYHKRARLFEILNQYLSEDDTLKYQWFILRDHLESCNIYYSWNEILIRPLIPPSLDNSQFNNAKQRLFMSATLGQGGDLERITGIRNFYKIPIPKGWDKQGMGRRYFMFPGLSLNEEDTGSLLSELMTSTSRTVVLVSSEDQVQNFRSELAHSHPDISFFTAYDIEKYKASFINSPKAAIVLANRFDGIDFAGDQSRLLFLIGIPYASNLQEKFLQSRMDASIIFYDRNRTRLIQAIGRCTRSPKDYSAICVLGEKDLSEWLLLRDKNKYLHPELQAELTFGIENSKEVGYSDFTDNFTEFINQTDAWKSADSEIIDLRSEMVQHDFDGASELEKTARLEVEFQYALWNKNYEKCFEIVSKIISGLDGGSQLRGYRAFWNYQAGIISEILYSISNKEVYRDKSTQFLEKLVRICPSATWSRTITDTVIEGVELDANLIWNIEYLQQYLSWKKISHSKSYNNYLSSIEGYIDSDDIENLNLHIGKLLGFKCENPTEDAAPDPYWISNDDFLIVFEDKVYENTEGEIKIEHLRQAASHEMWIKENVTEIKPDCTIITVLLSNRTSIPEQGKPFCRELKYWNKDEFVDFSRRIVSLARDFSSYYSGENDSNWKNFFIDEFDKRKLGPKQLVAGLKNIIDI